MSTERFKHIRFSIGSFLAVVLLMLARSMSAVADEPAKPESGASPVTAEQKQVADRFQQLKKALIRMSDPQSGTDARRAALVKQAVAKSNDWEIEAQFERIAALLEKSQLSAATKDQSTLRQDLKKLLDLLMSEDRHRRLQSEKERIRGYLKEINRIIKKQRGLEDQTSRAPDPKGLSKDQGELAQNTGKLAGDIKAAEGDTSADHGKESDKDKDPSGKSGGKPKPDGDKDDKQKDSKDKSDKNSSDKPQGFDKSKPTPGDKNPSGDKSQPGDKGKPQSGDSKPQQGDKGKPSGKPQDSQPGKGQGKPQEGQGQPQPGADKQDDQQQPDAGPPGQKRLERAQQRMQEAQRKLDESKKDDATQKQEEAVRELELAKAELEDILRQLREEEIARTLAMLESRFRKMLELQIEVYDGTKRVDAMPSAGGTRDREIESGRLSRKEADIVSQADRALSLLREEGSAVAFPEAVVEMRDDMEQVVVRLAQTKLDKITQGLEQDIIAALEEMIKAMQKAQKDLEKNKKQPPPMMAGEPQEPGLVDTLSELKMIRALQMRVNKRTQQYSRMTEQEQAEQPELLKALERLAEREARIHRITRDIVVGRNR